MTQKEMILKAFSENGNILMPRDLMRLGIAKYGSRITELRHKGHIIENESLAMKGRAKLTRFIYRGKLGKIDINPKKTLLEVCAEVRKKNDLNNPQRKIKNTEGQSSLNF